MEKKIKNNSLLPTIYVISFILFCLGLVVFYYVWWNDADKQVWNQDKDKVFQEARIDGKPIILAVTEISCMKEANPTCPQPDIADLKGFVLWEIIKGSDAYIELGYDDRFLPDIETPPVFYLLNSDGEIRSWEKEFPNEELLDRWRKIR